VHSRDATYGELGGIAVVAQIENMKAQMPKLKDADALTSVKALRQAVLRVRDTIDIFVFAYPDVDQKDNTWQTLRESLDEGYTLIGDFQDLQHVTNPDPKEQAKKLQKCLDWQADWEGKKKKNSWIDYIKSPKPNKLTTPRVQFSYYWKKIQKVPKDTLNGLENIARMEYHMINFVISSLVNILKIPDPITLVEHEEFHDFRKMLRSITFSSTFLPTNYSIYQSTFNSTKTLEYVAKIRSDFGDINDKITDYNYAKAHSSNSKQLKELEQVILVSWNKVKQYLLKGFEAQMTQLINGLIPFTKN